MQSITSNLTKELLLEYDPKTISKSNPLFVKSFSELVINVARLSYYNKYQLLFFRGQNFDYRNRSNSSVYLPSIYRGDYVNKSELEYRFNNLEEACKLLVSKFVENKITGFTELRRKKLIQWSILQHYEVCATPLLDFTHSIRVACSFAFLNNKNEFGYISVFGLPYLTNRISTNSEEDIVNIRLLSITPPDALRPYFQEGYLAGTTDVTTNFESKSELDFNNRLIFKFKIPITKAFWNENTEAIPVSSLYLPNDKILDICNEIKQILMKDEIRLFIDEWSEFEKLIISKSKKSEESISISHALKNLSLNIQIDSKTIHQIENLKSYKNFIVRNFKNPDITDLKANTLILKRIKEQFI